MTLDRLLYVLVTSALGFAIGAFVARRRIVAPPAALMRTNVNGRQVPAVLGGAVVAGGLAAVVLSLAGDAAGLDVTGSPRDALAVGVVAVVMGLAGAWDDRRGDERPRGFSGHLRALRGGALTGGVLKIAAGAVAGGAAGLLVHPDDVEGLVATALLVALGANTVNLFDRAPGRAGKIGLLAALPLLAAGDPGWTAAAAGAIGALVACLPLDLAERGMLGDAGANPLGAVVGLGFATSVSGTGRWAAVLVLLALNVASERWSFSRAIERTPVLDRLDRMGRDRSR